MKMTDEAYEKYQTFMLDKRAFRANRTPEQREFFYSQVKNRVLTFLTVLGKHDLRNMLAKYFYDEANHYDEAEAWRQAHDLGYMGMGINDNPYFWYCLLKPYARKLANDAKAFTKHFDK